MNQITTITPLTFNLTFTLSPSLSNVQEAVDPTTPLYNCPIQHMTTAGQSRQERMSRGPTPQQPAQQSVCTKPSLCTHRQTPAKRKADKKGVNTRGEWEQYWVSTAGEPLTLSLATSTTVVVTDALNVSLSLSPSTTVFLTDTYSAILMPSLSTMFVRQTPLMFMKTISY